MGWVARIACTCTLAGGLALFAAGESEAAKKKPAPPPAAPPAPAPIPYRPWMPEQPPGNLAIPLLDAKGVRQTVNTGASPMQRTWNMRSAYNVAALSCRDAKHAAIIPNYRAFIRKHAKGLTAANRAVDAEFRARHGTRFVAQREAYMTKVYNHYSLPPVIPKFCDAALAVSEEAKAVALGTLNVFSASAVPRLDAPFEDFYTRYDKWMADGRAWDAQYAALYYQRYGKLYPGSTIPVSAVPAAQPTTVRSPT